MIDTSIPKLPKKVTVTITGECEDGRTVTYEFHNIVFALCHPLAEVQHGVTVDVSQQFDEWGYHGQSRRLVPAPRPPVLDLRVVGELHPDSPENPATHTIRVTQPQQVPA